MRNCDDSTLLETPTDCPLDDLVSLVVDVGSGLVHHYDFIALQHASRQAKQLLLSLGEVNALTRCAQFAWLLSD